LHSDRGSAFIDESMNAYLHGQKIKHNFSAVHDPKSNPTERSNREIKTKLRTVIDANQKSWDKNIPQIQLAINSTVNQTTGYAPMELMFGGTARLVSDTEWDEILNLQSLWDHEEKLRQIVAALETEEVYQNVRR